MHQMQGGPRIGFEELIATQLVTAHQAPLTVSLWPSFSAASLACGYMVYLYKLLSYR